MIRILIADDHLLLAESLQHVLHQEGEIEVIALSQNGYEAVEMCYRHNPDLVLMDIKMMDWDGLKAAEIIRRDLPHIKIAILTTFEDKSNIITALRIGVDGYILKDIKPQELILSIKSIQAGFFVAHSSVKRIIAEKLAGFTGINSKNKDFIKSEDLEIIKLIATGMNNKEIADKLNYSEGTIKNRISKIIEILGVKDRTQLVIYALKNDLI